MLPSRQESYELIEDCTQISKEVIDLLDMVIPYLVENDRKEELATLIRLSFADIRATIDAVTLGCDYLKEHDTKIFASKCLGVNTPPELMRSGVNGNGTGTNGN